MWYSDAAFVELGTRVVEVRLDAVLAVVPSGVRPRFAPRVVDLPGDAVPELPAELELQRVVVLERAVGDELRGVDAGVRQERGVGPRDPRR